jgi:very-short-patch-repair endonuclease
MSLNKNPELTKIAKMISRDLRRNATPAENILWQELRNKKFHNRKFYRQHPIFHDYEGKESFFVADFYCHQLQFIIELDGPIHKYKLKEDKNRKEILNMLGLDVIRFDNEEIEKDLNSVLGKLKNYIEKRNSQIN